jgi:aminomethyltransferase
MHSSYALSSDDFAVVRGDDETPGLDALWPGGWRPDDRLGVVMANPMDGAGCSNLICATTTLFYDHLRDTRGTGNFFRYADNFLLGVGCEPGDFNQLDVWPLHKFVTILQPTAEAVMEAVTDRRITLLAVPETGARCRGEVVLSTWNTFLETVRCIVTYSPLTGRARDANVELVGNKVVESYVEQAIFSTPGIDAGMQARLRRLRRNLDRVEKQPVETYRMISTPSAARALLGVTTVLPPGHQELTRRSTPTAIMPVEVPMPPADALAPPFDQAAAAALQVIEPPPANGGYQVGLLRTAFDAIQRRMGGSFAEWEGWDWISDFGDPIAEHHTVRESVGIWDESPLRKWMFSGPDALRAADRCFTSDMAGLDVGQCRYGPFCDEHGKMLGDGVVYYNGPDEDVMVVTALESDADHFRRVCSGLDMEITERTHDIPHLQVQGPGSRELLQALTDADVAGLRYFRHIPHAVTIAGVDGCWVSRTGYSGELGFEVFCPAASAEKVWQGMLDQGASVGIRPYGLAAVESLRIEAGLIFLGYDYWQAVTSPFHVNLDRMVKLDKPEFCGQAALRAEQEAGITHRMVTLVIAGEEPPDYGSPVFQRGRGVGKLTSPSAGRSPTVDKLIALACIEAELAELGTQVEVTLPDGRTVPALVDRYPIYDPEKTRPRS